MLSLRELQMLSEQEYSIEDTRKDLNRIMEYFRGLEYQEHAIDIAFIKERELPKEIADQQKIFFVDDETLASELPEEFCTESLGFVKNNRLVYAGRLVYPVFDVKGDVMGFCGWDKFEKPKYLDSQNHGYTAKQTTFFGMEMLPTYYRNNKPVYVVEGIVCCLYLRSIGLQAIALLGSGISPYVIQILKRMENRLIIIPDNDIVGKSVEEITETAAGEHFVRVAKKNLPKAVVIQSVIAKDVDDTRKLDEHKHEMEFRKELLQVAVCPYYNFKTIRVR